MSDRLDEILGACKRTSAVLARLPRGAGREPERDPYEPRPFQYTEEQQKEIAKYGRTLLCRECQNPDAWWDMDSGTPTCSHCGGEDANVPSDACEKRFFADDEKQARDAKKRNEEYKDEENFHLSKILPREIPGNCAREDLWAANNRLNQCVVWLQMLTRDESPGGFHLTVGEVRTGRILLRAVCVQWAKEGFADDNFGNPILWAIGVGLQMVAMRPEGFAMPTQHLCERVTLTGLHAWLKRYRSDAVFMAYESTLSMTSVRGTDARLGALAAEHRVQRRAAFHELGDTPHKRYNKMLVLHKLIVNSGFYGHGVGLADPVLKLHRPALMKAEQPKVRVWPLRRVVVGVDTAMAQHRSDTDTDAESVYEEDSVPASPQHALEAFDGVEDTDADDERSKADDGGGRCARPPPAPMPVTEMPYAAENVAIPPGGESTLSEIDQQLAVAEQLADPLAHMALEAGFGDAGHEGDDGDSNATHPYFLSSDGEYAASDALPEDIDLSDEVWEQQVEAERAELDAKEARSDDDDDDDDDDDEQPPKLQPASKRKPIPLSRLKTATLAQVRACSQYWQRDESKAQAFYNRWKEESKAHREVLRLKREEKKQKEEALAAAQAAASARREEAQAAREAAREAKEQGQADRREARGWNQFLEQAAKKERAEALLERGQGVCFVTPTEELTDRKAGTVAKISVNFVLPTLRLPALPAPPPPAEEVGELKAVRVKLAGTARPFRRAPRGKRKAPEEEEASEPGADPYARKFKERRRPAP